MNKKLSTAGTTMLGCLILAACGGGGGGGSNRVTAPATPQQTQAAGYATHVFVSNSASYNPELGVVPALIDAWGVALRPAGDPGHFWVMSGNKSYEYLGGVTGKAVAPCSGPGVLCADLAPLPTNTVTFPDFPVVAKTGAPDIINNHATGVAFNGDSTAYIITQTPSSPSANLTPNTSSAAFLFVTNYGAIYAWTERADGTSYDRADSALKIFDSRDNPADCGQFYGMTLSAAAGRMYVADFGADVSSACNNPAAIAAVPKSFGIRVFDKTLNANGTLNEITSTLNSGQAFVDPFVGDPNNIKAGDYVPWNVAAIGNSIFVAYVQIQQDPAGAAGRPFPANEVHGPSAGRIAEFDVNGKLIKVWNDAGRLNAPWGMTVAPADFGTASNQLLVGNFGDFDVGGSQGAITRFDMTTKTAVDVLRNTSGSPLLVPGIWGMVFGNGDTIGDSNALYYAAGPNGELDGLFGSIRTSSNR